MAEVHDDVKTIRVELYKVRCVVVQFMMLPHTPGHFTLVLMIYFEISWIRFNSNKICCTLCTLPAPCSTHCSAAGWVTSRLKQYGVITAEDENFTMINTSKQIIRLRKNRTELINFDILVSSQSHQTTGVVSQCCILNAKATD